jgi:PAS domain S-box-containing protein
VEANPAAARIAGRNFMGQRMREIDPEYEDYWYEIYTRVASTGQAEHAEHYAKPHGRWFEFNISKVGNGPSRRVAVVFQDITDRKRSEEALRKSEEKFRSIFENIDEGYALIELERDENGMVRDFAWLEVNPAFERQSGVVRIVGKKASEVTPNVDPHSLEVNQRVADTGVPKRIENYNVDLDRWFDVVHIRVGGEGSSLVGVVFTDISERKRAEIALRESERHAKTLLAEIQHRVRNTLAVVRSIARRTADNSASVSEMVDHFQGRLDAFARVQAALTRSADSTVDLVSLVEEELLAHAAHDGRQVQISGPEVALGQKTAERISLAIHELTTNAVKHGALTNGAGQIRVSWKNGGDRLLLRWEESGVKLRSRSIKREGFGMELLRRSLPYDLHADTKVELRPKGLFFELDMPLPQSQS